MSKGKKRPSARKARPVHKIREFKPGEYEDIALPGGITIEPGGGQFEEVELETLSRGMRVSVERLKPAKQALERKLLLNVTESALAAESGTEKHGFENIVGVGISEKIIEDELTGEPCIVVYVVAKVPKDEIAEDALVPEEVNGIPTDVVATGELHAMPFRGRYRPALGGASIGHYKITAGTLGCLVAKDKALYILSNNHVLANTNQAKIDDPILQPGPTDGGTSSDVIAKLSKFIPLQFGGAVNQVDCAIAQTSPKMVSPLTECYGKISPTPSPCQLNLLVKKCGRTTQFSRGRVTDCNASVWVGYGTNGKALFQDQIIVQSLTPKPFSQPGDSGSLIVTDGENRPVSLLFAGSSSHTISNPIGAVLAALDVQIVT